MEIVEGKGVLLTFQEFEEIGALLEQASVLDVAAITEGEDDPAETTAATEALATTYCCKYFKGDTNDRNNPNKYWTNLRTRFAFQADLYCVLRAVRTFGGASRSGSHVSRGGCKVTPGDGWKNQS